MLIPWSTRLLAMSKHITETSHFWAGRFPKGKAGAYFTEVWDKERPGQKAPVG
jgi:hypothetical protein